MTIEKSIPVLIVDDDEVIRTSLTQVLEERGFSVTLATNGKEGLEIIESAGNRIHIVICDIVMPKLDGLGFLEKVHEYNPSVEVIMVTGNSTLERCVEALEKGACGYLCKPFGIKEIIDNITRAQRNIREKKEMIREALNQNRKQSPSAEVRSL